MEPACSLEAGMRPAWLRPRAAGAGPTALLGLGGGRGRAGATHPAAEPPASEPRPFEEEDGPRRPEALSPGQGGRLGRQASLPTQPAALEFIGDACTSFASHQVAMPPPLPTWPSPHF